MLITRIVHMIDEIINLNLLRLTFDHNEQNVSCELRYLEYFAIFSNKDVFFYVKNVTESLFDEIR